ncbi:MAG: hypothetical protein J2P23_04440 [Microlunatus sp.]|nr:hypothetical protein [Microlunatus sp.]
MIGTGAGTAIAITLAVIDSTCFAAAAVYQQRAVRQTAGHRLTLRELIALPTHPEWLGGVGLATVGICLHVIALILAPVALVQPIGVLGVPIAVLLAARLSRQPPPRTTIIPIVLCIAGIGAFIWLTASYVSSDTIAPLWLLAVTQAAVLVAMAVAALAAGLLHRWARCLLLAVAGAFGIGMVAALMRALIQHIDGDFSRLFDLHSLVLAALMAISGASGGWLVQQAYASGPAEVVLASLTVVDPMIAVLVGLMLLGEGNRLPLGAQLSMILCGLVAAAGVFALARTHPQVAARQEPCRDLTGGFLPRADSDREVGVPDRIIERVL